MRPLDGPIAVIRTDPAPGFKAFADDDTLKQHRISIEIGHAKNPNKNPVAERTVQEVVSELLHRYPLGGPVSHVTLAPQPQPTSTRVFEHAVYQLGKCGPSAISFQTNRYLFKIRT
jgi:hypothetical protein